MVFFEFQAIYLENACENDTVCELHNLNLKRDKTDISHVRLFLIMVARVHE